MKNTKVMVGLLAVLAVFVLGLTLYLLQSVLLPLIIAVFLSYLFKPLVNWLEKKNVPTAISLVIVFISIAAFVFGVSMVIYTSIDSVVAEAPGYQEKLNTVAGNIDETVRGIASRIGVPMEQFDWKSAFNISAITGVLGTGLGSTVAFGGNVILVLLYMFFILASNGNLIRKVRKAYPADHSEKVTEIVTNIDKQVRQYILTKTIVSLISGAITTIVLLLFGVDFALFWGFLTFLFNYIPNVGSVISELLPVAFAFLQFDSFVTPLIILAILVGLDMVTGNIIEPKMMAFSLNLSPLVVLVALIFWGWLWGIPGMLIAVPMTAILKIIFENIEALKPLATMMGGGATAKA